MTEEKKIVDELNKITTEMRSYVDRKFDEAAKTGAADPLTLAAIEKANAAITELRAEHTELLKASKRPAAPEGKQGADSPEAEVRKSAFVKFLRGGIGETARCAMTPEEVRALSSASDSEGGFLVPPAWESAVLMQAFDAAEIRGVSNVASTGRDQVFMPALKKPSVAWGVTNIAVSPQELSAGGERLQVHDLRALALLHNNTLDDADADIWGELQTAFGLAIAEAEDDAFATGNGTTEPQGLMTNKGVLANFTVSGVASALSDSTHNGVDPLIAMLYGLKKPYRANATWAMNSITEGVVRQLKSEATGQYLWQPPVSAGAPATLLGRPLINPEGMASVGAGAFPIAVGDFRTGYRIRDRSGISVQRLVERYAEYDQTGFLIKRRTGGKVVMSEAFKVLKIAAS